MYIIALPFEALLLILNALHMAIEYRAFPHDAQFSKFKKNVMKKNLLLAALILGATSLFAQTTPPEQIFVRFNNAYFTVLDLTETLEENGTWHYATVTTSPTDTTLAAIFVEESGIFINTKEFQFEADSGDAITAYSFPKVMHVFSPANPAIWLIEYDSYEGYINAVEFDPADMKLHLDSLQILAVSAMKEEEKAFIAFASGEAEVVLENGEKVVLPVYRDAVGIIRGYTPGLMFSLGVRPYRDAYLEVSDDPLRSSPVELSLGDKKFTAHAVARDDEGNPVTVKKVTIK